MPRTFVWHPGKGPEDDRSKNALTTGKVRIKQVRSGIGHSWRMRRDARGDRAQAPPGRGGRSRIRPSLRGQLKQVRHLVEVTPVEESRPWRRRRHDGREDRPAQPRAGAGLAPRPQAARPRPGLGHGQDVGQGTQGHQGARGPSRPGRRQAAVRGRPDAAHAPAAEARLHEPVPRGIEVVRLDELDACSSGEVTPESLRAAGLIEATRDR